MTVCSVVDCARPVRAADMCAKHYAQRWHQNNRKPPTRPRPAATGHPTVELLAAVLAGAPSLPGSRCRQHPALFDERGADEPAEVAEQRHAQALKLCAACPALASCERWYSSLPARKRPTGVVAGRTPAKKGRPPKAL